MENWKERFNKRFGVKEGNPLMGYSNIDIKASTRVDGSVKELEDFISQELDKAREEEREKMVRIQFPKTIQRIEQEAERRGAINILKKVRDSADGLYDEDRDWHEVLYGVLEAELKLLEEENGKQNAR